LTYDWRRGLPDGYAILPMEIGMLKRDDLQIPSQVKTTLGKWMSIKDDRFRDYGFVVVHEDQVAAWATVDFVVAGAGDLGFETLPAFQKRGLGSAVAAAALEHGLQMGIEVHWTSAEDNIGSQRTAQKLGLVNERDYTMYFFALDLSDHQAQLAYSFLARGEHRRAIDCYEQLFAQKADVPTWAYYDTALAWAALGESENAFKYLRIAAKHGWPAVDATEQTPEFQILHDSPEWKNVIERIRQNQK
jgi:RimJ/RimL family protein N-acetyltransferase